MSFLDSVIDCAQSFRILLHLKKPDPPSTLNQAVEAKGEVATAAANSNDLLVVFDPMSLDPSALGVPSLEPPAVNLAPLDLLPALDQQALNPSVEKTEDVPPYLGEINETEDVQNLGENATKKKRYIKRVSIDILGKNGTSPNLKIEGGVLDLENLKSDANMRRAAAMNLKMQKKRNQLIDPEADVSGWLFGQTEACFDKIFHEDDKNNKEI